MTQNIFYHFTFLPVIHFAFNPFTICIFAILQSLVLPAIPGVSAYHAELSNNDF
jgi:hypothetical protein